MKFEINFQNVSGSVYVRGLRLLDAVREQISNIKPEQVVDSVRLAYNQTVELTEDVARASGKFEDQDYYTVYVDSANKDWRELHYVMGVESTDDSKIAPIFKFDPWPLIAAWAKQGYPVDKRIQYPFTEET